MLKERLGKELLFFDGGTGTLLQERGLAPGELPETWNLMEIHLKTGRHHQIRVQFAGHGHPLWGDNKWLTAISG